MLTNHKLNKPSKSAGYSLIEILIVLAIIGIVAGIAYPSYASYVLKTQRTDAALALLEATQAMERCKSSQFSYQNCVLSPRLSESPEKLYTIALSPAPTASTYTLVATPDGNQVNDSECTSISIDHLGRQTSKPGADGTDTNGCWN